MESAYPWIGSMSFMRRFWNRRMRRLTRMFAGRWASDRQVSGDCRSVSRTADDFERAADLVHALAHPEDSEVTLSREVVRSCVETAPVIVNIETHARWPIR